MLTPLARTSAALFKKVLRYQLARANIGQGALLLVIGAWYCFRFASVRHHENRS